MSGGHGGCPAKLLLVEIKDRHCAIADIASIRGRASSIHKRLLKGKETHAIVETLCEYIMSKREGIESKNVEYMFEIDSPAK